MAGYSGTPLPRKLGIKEDCRLRLFGAPEGFARLLSVAPRLRGEADVIVFFARRSAELRGAFGRLRKALHPDGGLRFVVRLVDR